MIRKIIFFITICLICSHTTFGQASDNLYERLRAIANRDVKFYNVDGIEITSQKVNAEFTSKNIVKKFKQLKIKENELISSDSTLDIPNFYVFKTEEEPQGMHNNIALYFIESTDKKIIGFTFSSVNKSDKQFERIFVRLVWANAIPESVFSTIDIDSIDFAGRKISLGSSCHWMGINNVQCPYYGQMNWSVHKTLSDASETVNNQLVRIKSGNKGKVVSDTIVTVIFEGTETSARRIVYDFTGVTSVLVGMTGGKTLTIYFVAAPVRNNFVSCIMSFWNNDQVNPSGLSPLLEQVMKHK